MNVFKMALFFMGVAACLLAGCAPVSPPVEDAATGREDSGPMREDAGSDPMDSAIGADADPIAWSSCEIGTGVWRLSYTLPPGSDPRCDPYEDETVCLCDAAADPARCLHDATLDELVIVATDSACESRPGGTSFPDGLATAPACETTAVCFITGSRSASLTKASIDSARGSANVSSSDGSLVCGRELSAALIASACPDPCADPEYIGVECNLPDEMVYARDEFLCASFIDRDRWLGDGGYDGGEYTRDYRGVLYASLNFAQYNGSFPVLPGRVIEFTCGPEGACWFNWANLDSHYSRCRVGFGAGCLDATVECWSPGSSAPTVSLAYWADEIP